jgi:hypothetical protein
MRFGSVALSAFFVLFAFPAQAVFFDRPDYFENKAIYDEIDDIIDVLYDKDLSEKDRYLRLMVKDKGLVDSCKALKQENEKRLAEILREQGLSKEQIDEKFAQRNVIDAFKFTMENDYLNKTDREYSNGLRVELSFNNPGFEKFFKSLGYSHADFYAVCAQEIHTNSHPKRAVKDPNEPPMAGVLYCGPTVGAYKMDAERARMKMLDRFEMRLGSVGEMALGEQVQNGFHKLIKNKAVNWDYQLKDRVYLSVSFERNLKLSEGSLYGNSYPDYNIILNGGAVAGTFTNQAGGNVILNFRLLGSLIDMYMGQQMSRSKIESLRTMSMEARLKKTMCERDWGVNLFVSGGAKFVLNNQRFDAQSCGHSTEHVPFVYNLKAGVLVHYKQAMFEFSWVKNSPQWMSTSGSEGDMSHVYNSASITLTEDAFRDSLNWVFNPDYRNAVREKNKFRKMLRREGVKVVYQAEGEDNVEKSFTLRCR